MIEEMFKKIAKGSLFLAVIVAIFAIMFLPIIIFGAIMLGVMKAVISHD